MYPLSQELMNYAYQSLIVIIIGNDRISKDNVQYVERRYLLARVVPHEC